MFIYVQWCSICLYMENPHTIFLKRRDYATLSYELNIIIWYEWDKILRMLKIIYAEKRVTKEQLFGGDLYSKLKCTVKLICHLAFFHRDYLYLK